MDLYILIVCISHVFEEAMRETDGLELAVSFWLDVRGLKIMIEAAMTSSYIGLHA